MPFQPFQSEYANHRAVVIPPDLSGDARDKFVAKIAAAVKQHAGLASKCPNILRVSGEPKEHDGRILIRHESAAPLDPARLAEPDELPSIETLWWLSWATIDALKAAAAAGAPHGGIQGAALYRDEAGRVKLGDFGIAAAFETICGIESRRQIHCDATVTKLDAAHTLSGTWTLLDEDAPREHGWIVPFFAHELFEGRLRFNAKSDQFSLGVLLFLLATGTHPYGAALSDPSLMFYFHLEPFNVGDERSEWQEMFERQAKDLSGAADKPVLMWSDFVQTLLASDSGSRYPNPAEAEKTIAEFQRPQWSEASKAVDASLADLDAGDADAFLKKVAPWKDAEPLPDLWRARLGEWVAAIEAQKEVIARLRRLRQRIEEGQQALDDLDIAQARAIAQEVLDAPESDEALEQKARALLDQCREQEDFIRSGADELAKAYLESARECVEREQFDEARQLLDGILHDPGTPSTRLSQAREMHTELELIKQRIEHQLAELNGAIEDVRGGRYDAARQRLESLLAEQGLSEAVGDQARMLLEDVTRTQEQRAVLAQALEEARSAWEMGDADQAAAKLSQVAEEFDDEEITDVRADLTARVEQLHAALEHRTEAERARSEGDLDAALLAAEAAGQKQLPQIVRDQVDQLIEECRTGIEQARRERIENANKALRAAEAAWERGDAAKTEAQLAQVPEQFEEPAVRGKRRELAARLEQLTLGLEYQAAAEEAHAESDFESALTSAEQAAGLELPTGVRSAIDALIEQSKEHIETARRERIARASAALDAAERAWNACEPDSMQTHISEVPEPFEDSAVSKRRTALVERIDHLRVALQHKAQAEQLQSAQDHEQAIQEALRALERELPDSMQQSLEALVETCREQIEEAHRALIKKAQTALGKAHKLYERAKFDDSKKLLETSVLVEVALPGQDRKRAEELLGSCTRALHVRSEIEKARGLLGRGAFDDAFALLEAIGADGLPETLVENVQTLREQVEQARSARLAEQAGKLAERLREAEAKLESGALDDAEAIVVEVEQSAYATDDLKQAAARTRQAVHDQRPIIAAIRAAAAALDDEEAEVSGPLTKLDALPDPLPGWAAKQVSEIRKRAAQIEDERRQRRIKKTHEALEAASAAADEGRAADAESALKRAEPGLELQPALAQRHTDLTAALVALREWTPKLVAVEQLLADGDIPAAHRDATALHEDADAPPAMKKRLAEVLAETKRRIVARREEVDRELEQLNSELGQRGRKARRFVPRAEAIISDALASKTQRDKAAELLAAYNTLPEPKASRLPLVVGGAAAAVLAISAAVYFWPQQPDATEPIQGALERLNRELATLRDTALAADRPDQTWSLAFQPKDAFETRLYVSGGPDHSKSEYGVASDEAALAALKFDEQALDFFFPSGQTPGPGPTIRTSMDQALARLAGQVSDAAAAIRGAPSYELSFSKESLPAELVAKDRDDGKPITLVSGVTEATVDTLSLPDGWEDTLFLQPIRGRLELARRSLQAEVDVARQQAQQAGRDAPTYALRFESVGDQPLPASLIAERDDSRETIPLDEIDADAITHGLRLTDEWRQRLYPAGPTVPDRMRATLARLQNLMDGAWEAANRPAPRWVLSFDAESLPAALRAAPEAGGDAEPVYDAVEEAQLDKLQLPDGWRNRFYATAPALTPDELRAAALEAVTAPGLRVEGIDPYGARLEQVQESDVTIEKVDEQGGTVTLSIRRTRLDGDRRGSGRFLFRGVYDGAVLRADADTAAAFDAYLKKLQEVRINETLAEIEQALSLSGTGLSLSRTGPNAGGNTAAIEIGGKPCGSIATVEANWNAESLEYAFDQNAAQQALAAGVRKIAQTNATRAALREQWPGFKSELFPRRGAAAGRGYLERCALLDVTLQDKPTDDPLVLGVNAVIGPQAAAAQDRISFTARIGFVDCRFGWEPATQNVRNAIRGRLNALATDKDFRERRVQDALAALATQLGVNRTTLREQRDPDALIVDRGRIRYTSEWNADRLEHTAWSESEVPVPPLGERLSALAQAGDVPVEDFVKVLNDMTNAKIERLGPAAGLVLLAHVGNVAAADQLLDTGRKLQTFLAPQPTRDPIPTVFVEYFAGERDLYGLAWSVETSPTDTITGVLFTRVWKVMPLDELHRFADPEQFRKAYSKDPQLGQKLLGPALDDPLVASGGGSFGLVIAPESMLWLTRWEQVRFEPRTLKGVKWMSGDPPGADEPVTSLRDVVEQKRLGRNFDYRRAGIWCVPTLSAATTLRRPNVNIKDLVPGTDGKASFRPGGRDQFLFASIENPLSKAGFRVSQEWARFTKGVARADIGYKFWNVWGWTSDGRWNDPKTWSIALLPRAE